MRRTLAMATAVVPRSDAILCRRCGIERKSDGYLPDPRTWRCRDCRDLECGNGHLWPDEPYLDVRGHRKCMQCEAEFKRRWYQRNKETA